MEGVNGLIVAADMAGDGHYTEYPSDVETVALQIPFEGGLVPEHKVLWNGACRQRSQVREGCGKEEGKESIEEL